MNVNYFLHNNQLDLWPKKFSGWFIMEPVSHGTKYDSFNAFKTVTNGEFL